MSSENHQYKPDVYKIKLEEIHQTLLSTTEICKNSKSRCFVKCCKEKSLKRFDCKCLHTFSDFSMSGKLFEILL